MSATTNPTSSTPPRTGNSAPNAFFDQPNGSANGPSQLPWAMPGKLFAAQIAASRELLAFAGKRMQAQAEFIEKMSHCGSLDQAATTQRAFFETANEHYSAELGQLMEFANKNMSLMTDAAVEPPSALQTR